MSDVTVNLAAIAQINGNLLVTPGQGAATEPDSQFNKVLENVFSSKSEGAATTSEPGNGQTGELGETPEDGVGYQDQAMTTGGDSLNLLLLALQTMILTPDLAASNSQGPELSKTSAGAEPSQSEIAVAGILEGGLSSTKTVANNPALNFLTPEAPIQRGGSIPVVKNESSPMTLELSSETENSIPVLRNESDSIALKGIIPDRTIKTLNLSESQSGADQVLTPGFTPELTTNVPFHQNEVAVKASVVLQTAAAVVAPTIKNFNTPAAARQVGTNINQQVNNGSANEIFTVDSVTRVESAPMSIAVAPRTVGTVTSVPVTSGKETIQAETDISLINPGLTVNSGESKQVPVIPDGQVKTMVNESNPEPSHFVKAMDQQQTANQGETNQVVNLPRQVSDTATIDGLIQESAPDKVVSLIRETATPAVNQGEFQRESQLSKETADSSQSLTITGSVQTNPSIRLEQPENANLTSKTTPLDQKDIVAQVMERAKVMVRDGYSEMEVTLKPEQLGKVQLRVSLENHLVTAKFMAESQQVREIIETHLPELKRSLQETGIQVDSFSVTTNNFNQSGDFRQSAQQQQSFSQYSRGYQRVGEGSNPTLADRQSVPRVSNSVIDLIA